MSFWEFIEKPTEQEMSKTLEKGMNVWPSSTTHCTLDGPINAFCTSKDGLQVAVAGRNVFKIIAIDQDNNFQEKTNLRVGRINLNFSITDVQWHPVEDHILATAAGNGAVVIWNLNKITKQKQELVFYEHKRTVNRIKFHPQESTLLLSGSQDGTMNCFDIRKQSVLFSAHGKSESIRDIEFSPFDGKLFATACDNGNVQLWDMRRTDTYYHQFMAHNGPVFTLDWHPEERNWIATGGRDKCVKIWDVQGKAAPINNIQTISSVARIKWRPQRKYQIASCALLVDFDIHVWDIRRPYIPYATFSEHKDVPTGILWRQTARGKDPHVFLSCSKDCTLYQHVFSDAYHPADHAPPMALALNISGDISFAMCDKLTSASKTLQNFHTKTRTPLLAPGQSSFNRKLPVLSDTFFEKSNSNLFVFNEKRTSKDDHFKVLAKSYRLSGRPFAELCDHNRNVASSLLLHKHAQTWSMLKALYSDLEGVGANKLATSSKPPPLTLTHGVTLGTTGTTDQSGSLLASSQTPIVNPKTVAEPSSALQPTAGLDASNVQDDDDSSSSSSLEENPKLMNIASGGNPDFLFGEEQDDGNFYFEEQGPLDGTGQDWTLPSEAFQPRQVITERPTSPSVEQEQERAESPTSGVESETTSATVQRTTLEPANPERRVAGVDSTEALFLPKWDFTSLVVEVLYHLAEEGDIQMCVSLLIVLGDKVRDRIDEQTQEQWLMSYLDLLTALELWSVATEITKLSSLHVVSTQNQASTTVYLSCGRCNKPLSGWFCSRCQIIAQRCSICHLSVRGPYVWCQGCSHGGHLHHIQEWFTNHVWCPAGCGHMCEFM